MEGVIKVRRNSGHYLFRKNFRKVSLEVEERKKKKDNKLGLISSSFLES